MPVGVILESAEYEELLAKERTLQLWNEFMDNLDRDPSSYIKLVEELGKPGDALYTLFNAYQLKQAGANSEAETPTGAGT